MKRNVLWFVIVAAAALMQTTWLEAVRIRGVLPDLTLLLVLYFAIGEGEERAMFTGLVGGVFQDVLTKAPLGLYVLCNVAVGYTVGRLSTRLLTEHPVVKVGIAFASSMVHGLLLTFVSYVLSPELAAGRHIVARVVPQAFYTALVTPIVFLTMDRLLRRAPAQPHADGKQHAGQS